MNMLTLNIMPPGKQRHPGIEVSNTDAMAILRDSLRRYPTLRLKGDSDPIKEHEYLSLLYVVSAFI